MIPMPIWSLPTMALAALLMCGGAWWMGDRNGMFVERAAQTQQQLANANGTIKKMGEEQKNSDDAGVNHDHNSTQVNVDTSAIGKALQNALAKIPPSSDPLVPAWFVRLHDRAASRYVGADPLPGQLDGDTSSVRLSVVGAMLTANYGKGEACRVQLTDLINYAKDANARRENIEPKSLLDRLGL